MQNNLTNKTIAIAIFVLFALTSVVPSAMSLTSEINVLNESYIYFEKNKIEVKPKNVFDLDEVNNYPIGSESSLKIEEINGGIGLSFILLNTGNVDIMNIELKIEAIGRFMKILSPDKNAHRRIEVCSYCGRQIRKWAIRCPYCRSNLPRRGPFRI